MATVSVRIPQIGEGLQEARLVAVLKQPGESIKRDEPIYQMETDKAVMDVESPYEGTLTEWLASVDAILPIGGEVARMEVAEGVAEIGGGHETAAPREAASSVPPAAESAAARNAAIPPRTRAYAKEKGIADSDLAAIPSATGKLMPSDIDAHLASAKKPAVQGDFVETAVTPKQRLLASRLVRGSQLVVPGTMTVAVDWEPLENLRTRIKARGGEFQPSSFTIFAYAVAQALREFPAFRSTLVTDDTLRTYNHVALGIAVGLAGDELVLAVVPDADTLSWRDFAAKTRERIELARTGQDQANEAVTISLTNMQSFGLRDAVPVVVPPAVATLFLGEPYNSLAQEATDLKLQRTVNLALTFDHRVMNGVGAANFLNKVKESLQSIGGLVSEE
ncbi:MAG TPA: 2-oxo acid dehydrogenase subunit E2 [Fimbriimonadaceae bacterium]|nr:2-oxo acid dehydrogenase subunit E2 [Fimbriimonadaceae bacterium]